MANREFNPYDVLGVDKDFSTEDLKKAFKEKSKQLHPDITGGSSEDFENLKKAFDILTDPAKRSLYDEYGVDETLDIETESKMVAVQIVISALEGLPDSCEFDKEIAGIFKRCLDGIEEQERSAKKSRDKLQRRLDAIQKKPANDFLTKEIIKVIESYSRAMKLAQLNYRIHDSAFKLVKEYKFDVIKITYPLARMMAEDKQREARNNLYKNLGIEVGG